MLALAASVILAACGAGSGECSEDQVPQTATLTHIQESIFTPSCTFAGCHAGSKPAAQLDLSSVEASSAILSAPSVTTESGRLLVNPYVPEDSYLINKLTGENIERNDEYPDAEAMPAVGDAVCDGAIDMIALWIVDGCPI